MGSWSSLRSATACMAARAAIYRPAHWVCGRIGGGFILAYHELPSELFERQVEALRPSQPVHLDELFQRARSGKSTAGMFAITLDDGVATTVRDISAVCRRRHWPVTFYLPTAYLDERRGLPFQLWCKVLPHLPRAIVSLPSRALDLSGPGALEQFTADIDTAMYTQPRDRYQPVIEELVRWVIESGLATPERLRTPEPIPWREVSELSSHAAIRFESHGVSHTAVVALPAATLEAELETSRRRVREHTNRDCRHFCYPFGSPRSIGPAAPGIVAKAFDTAVTMSRGRLRRHPWSRTPRIPIYERDDPDMARLKILTL